MKKQIVNYVRVSTANQNEDRQLSTEFKNYVDKVSGLTSFTERPSAIKLLQDINGIKKIIVTSIDRLGRNAFDIQSTINLLVVEHGVQIQVLSPQLLLLDEKKKKEGINAIDPIAGLIMNVMASIAQIEKDAIRERTIAGIEIAKLNPQKYKGRKVGSKGDSQKIIDKNKPVCKCYDANMSISQTASITGKSYNAVKALFKILENGEYKNIA